MGCKLLARSPEVRGSLKRHRDVGVSRTAAAAAAAAVLSSIPMMMMMMMNE